MAAKIKTLLPRLKGKKILVLGDIILDEHIWSKVSRISPEAPVPIADVQKITHVPGGGANVANNIQTLGGKAYLIGVIGKDSSGEKLLKKLDESGISIENIVIHQSRPTSLKSRVIAHSQQVVRIDREDRSSLDVATLKQIEEKIEAIIDKMDAIVISDYGKGVVDSGLCQRLVEKAQAKKKIVAVDPKGSDYSKYRGATIITPNKKEAEVAAKEEISEQKTLEEVGNKLLKQVAAEAVLITRGEEGLSLFEKNGDITHIPTVATEVYDVSGAGDTVIGSLTLALSAGIAIKDAARLANYAAGVVVRKVGTATVTLDELDAFLSERVASEK